VRLVGVVLALALMGSCASVKKSPECRKENWPWAFGCTVRVVVRAVLR